MGYNRTLGHFTNSQELATVWASGQNYIVNQLVLDNNKLYRCITAHTSGATFAGDSAYWSGLNPGATVAISEGGTGQTTKTDAFDALAPTTTAGDLIVYNGTDNVRLPVGTDGQMIVADASQANKLKWATVPQGSKNYVTYSNFENNATTGWSLFNTTLDANKIPNGAITAGPPVTNPLSALAVSASSPLAGSYSLSVTSAGSINAAQGFITDVLTIDREDQAKVLTFSFYYEALTTNMNFSGTSSNTWAIYIHDGTNWIQPAGVYGMTQSSGAGLVTGTFQTNATGTSYRVAVICINGTSGAVSMRFDDFKLGPQTAPIGPVVTDWVNYTPTLKGSVSDPTLGTTGTIEGRWRRVGDSVEIQVAAYPNGSSISIGSGIYYFTIPTGMVVDGTKLKSDVGIGTYFNTGVNSDVGSAKEYAGGVGLYMQGGSFIASSFPAAGWWTAGDSLIVTARLPISGWSSQVQLSNDTDTRVVAASYNFGSIGLTATTAIAGIWGQVYDTHSAFTNANGRYTAPVSGYYRVSALSSRSSGSGNSFTLYRDGVFVTSLFAYSIAVGNVSGSYTIYLNAGQYLTFGVDGSFTAQAVFNIERLSGPSVVAASEVVEATYGSTAGNVMNNATEMWLDFPTKVRDTHNAVSGAGTGNKTVSNTGWKFTAPITGRYYVNAVWHVTSGAVANSVAYGYIAVNGAGQSHSDIKAGQNPVGDAFGVQINGEVFLNAGDYIEIVGYQANGANRNQQTNNLRNRVEIVRVGAY